MSRIVFSRASREDRREITTHTVKRFGLQQARRLRQQFEAALRTLASAPLSGRLREELDPPGFALRYAVVLKRFVVVYEPTDDGIRVARILHGARDLSRELRIDAGDD